MLICLKKGSENFTVHSDCMYIVPYNVNIQFWLLILVLHYQRAKNEVLKISKAVLLNDTKLALHIEIPF